MELPQEVVGQLDKLEVGLHTMWLLPEGYGAGRLSSFVAKRRAAAAAADGERLCVLLLRRLLLRRCRITFAACTTILTPSATHIH